MELAVSFLERANFDFISIDNKGCSGMARKFVRSAWKSFSLSILFALAQTACKKPRSTADTLSGERDAFGTPLLPHAEQLTKDLVELEAAFQKIESAAAEEVYGVENSPVPTILRNILQRYSSGERAKMDGAYIARLRSAAVYSRLLAKTRTPENEEAISNQIEQVLYTAFACEDLSVCNFEKLEKINAGILQLAFISETYPKALLGGAPTFYSAAADRIRLAIGSTRPESKSVQKIAPEVAAMLDGRLETVRAMAEFLFYSGMYLPENRGKNPTLPPDVKNRILATINTQKIIYGIFEPMLTDANRRLPFMTGVMNVLRQMDGVNFLTLNPSQKEAIVQQAKETFASIGRNRLGYQTLELYMGKVQTTDKPFRFDEARNWVANISRNRVPDEVGLHTLLRFSDFESALPTRHILLEAIPRYLAAVPAEVREVYEGQFDAVRYKIERIDEANYNLSKLLYGETGRYVWRSIPSAVSFEWRYGPGTNPDDPAMDLNQAQALTDGTVYEDDVAIAFPAFQSFYYHFSRGKKAIAEYVSLKNNALRSSPHGEAKAIEDFNKKHGKNMLLGNMLTPGLAALCYPYVKYARGNTAFGAKNGAASPAARPKVSRFWFFNHSIDLEAACNREGDPNLERVLMSARRYSQEQIPAEELLADRQIHWTLTIASLIPIVRVVRGLSFLVQSASNHSLKAVFGLAARPGAESIATNGFAAAARTHLSLANLPFMAADAAYFAVLSTSIEKSLKAATIKGRDPELNPGNWKFYETYLYHLASAGSVVFAAPLAGYAMEGAAIRALRSVGALAAEGSTAANAAHLVGGLGEAGGLFAGINIAAAMKHYMKGQPIFGTEMSWDSATHLTLLCLALRLKGNLFSGPTFRTQEFREQNENQDMEILLRELDAMASAAARAMPQPQQ